MRKWKVKSLGEKMAIFIELVGPLPNPAGLRKEPDFTDGACSALNVRRSIHV